MRSTTQANSHDRPAGFLNLLLHHPRKLLLRKLLFQAHLWLGVALSLYLVLMSLTGAILVYHADFLRWSLPHEIHSYSPNATAPVSAILEHTRLAFPGAIIPYIEFPTSSVPAFRINVRIGNREFTQVADPQTGDLLPHEPWIDFVYRLHRDLLLGDRGIRCNGVGALALLLLAASGVLLWWRGLRQWYRGLGVSFRRSWRRINYDLHHAIGFWTLLILMIWAVSGVYFAWDQPFTRAIAAISPLHGMSQPTGNGAGVTSNDPSVDAMIRTALITSSGGIISSVINPDRIPGEDVEVDVNLRGPDDYSYSDNYRFDARTGALRTIWHYGRNVTAGDWVLWSMQPLHFGSYWGRFMQALWCLFGISLAVLTATGLFMYWNRFLRFKRGCDHGEPLRS